MNAVHDRTSIFKNVFVEDERISPDDLIEEGGILDVWVGQCRISFGTSVVDGIADRALDINRQISVERENVLHVHFGAELEKILLAGYLRQEQQGIRHGFAVIRTDGEIVEVEIGVKLK